MGYDWSQGKSEGAVSAEAAGLAVAFKVAARIRKIGGRFRKCVAADVAAALAAHEWHHTSKFFREVNYYDFRDLGELEIRRLLRKAIAERNGKSAEMVGWQARKELFRAEAAQRGATRFIELSDGEYLLAAGPDGPPCKAMVGELMVNCDAPKWA
jgi:hypothetical protein